MSVVENYAASEYAMKFLKEIKKDYQKMKESCVRFEDEHRASCQRIRLDLDAFNIKKHPEYPAREIFQLPTLSDRDRRVFGEYLANREKMYLLEQCVNSIADEDTRQIAGMYYLERKTQQDIAAEIEHTKSYVSKKLNKIEKGIMPETIDRYWGWKYNVPAGSTCFWAGQWEQRFMRHQDALRGNLRLPRLSDIPWVKKLKRAGF